MIGSRIVRVPIMQAGVAVLHLGKPLLDTGPM